jgi:spore coat polysaccharide biosynthesis predicted glycosyltransferase SpsG
VKSRVLFRIAVSGRIGFGHLRRAVSLARALGVRPVLSVRGDLAAARRSAGGALVVGGTLRAAFPRVRPAAVVIDDPSAKAVRAALAAARRHSIPAATVHDVGKVVEGGRLRVDGSVAGLPRRRTSWDLFGPRYAILHPSYSDRRARARRTGVLVSLGGGTTARQGHAIAKAIARHRPDIEVRLARGFVDGECVRSVLKNVRLLRPLESLRGELARCAVAVTAGGVSLSEACALGTPVIAVPVTRGQERAVSGFARRGAAVRVAPGPDVAARVAAAVDALLDAPGRRARLGRAGRGLVDGRGAARVAAEIQRLIRHG